MLKISKLFENLIFSICLLSAAHNFDCTAVNCAIELCMRPLWLLPLTEAADQRYRNLTVPAPYG